MPNQFLSDEFGDIEDYFVTDYNLIDQYIGDTLWVWGYNGDGGLGVNNTTQRNTPVTTFLGGTDWKQMSGGPAGSHSLAIKTNGTLWNWGRNDFGQLGINTNTNRSTPVTTLLGGTNWKSISAGRFYSAALKTDGTLWAWGSNSNGQLGVNDTAPRSTPVTTILGGNNWKSISCGGTHILTLKTDGTLWAWGSNSNGQLGVNNTASRSTPVTTILGGNNWKSIASGYNNSSSIKTDGTLWNWGNNFSGELGVNDRTNRNTPVTTILGGNNWKSIATESNTPIALKTNGTLWTWGLNNNGQLGVNDTASRSTPVTTILGGTNWKSIAGGGNNAIAIKTDGTLWIWGSNLYGELGVNDTTARSTPVTTILGGTNWKSFYNSFVGGYHSMAITAGINVDFS